MLIVLFDFCCSMDARGSEFSKAVRWSDETVFANRAHFLAERIPAALAVDHIREADAGVYRCRVDFKFAQTRNSKVNLTVIGESSFYSSQR